MAFFKISAQGFTVATLTRSATHSLPDQLKANLSTIERLAMELDAVANELSK